MATAKKPAAKPAGKAKPAVKESSSRALSLWEQEMAEVATAQSATEVITGGFKAISLKSGILSVDDNPVDGNELNVVVLAFIHENQKYDGIYNPDVANVPTCYAFGHNDDEMKPHEAAPDKQAELCAGCWANEYGSADIGKGKACKNVRRLVVITQEEAETVEGIENAEPRMLKLPVMSVKNWSTYVLNTLNETLHRPCYGVVTTVKVVPDAKSQFRVQFKFDSLVDFDEELYEAMKAKVKEAEGSIGNAYPIFEEEEKPVKGRRPVNVPVKAASKGKPAPAAAAKRGKY